MLLQLFLLDIRLVPVMAALHWRSLNNMLKTRRTFKYRLYPNRKQRESNSASGEYLSPIMERPKCSNAL